MSQLIRIIFYSMPEPHDYVEIYLSVGNFIAGRDAVEKASRRSRRFSVRRHRRLARSLQTGRLHIRQGATRGQLTPCLHRSSMTDGYVPRSGAFHLPPARCAAAQEEATESPCVDAEEVGDDIEFSRRQGHSEDRPAEGARAAPRRGQIDRP